jgi:hypothetical protein
MKAQDPGASLGLDRMSVMEPVTQEEPMTRPIVVRPTIRRPTHDAREREIHALRREIEILRQALETRRLVDRAKGHLMTREGLSEPEAFRRIQKTSMDTRTPMADIARGILRAIEGHRSAVGAALDRPPARSAGLVARHPEPGPPSRITRPLRRLPPGA